MPVEIMREVLNVWFMQPDQDGRVPQKQQMKWWKKDPDFDALPAEKFAQHVLIAARGEYDSCLSDVRSGLALIILLDQISRNVFRGTAQMFTQDEHACYCANEMMRQGLDKKLKLIERHFIYMPFAYSVPFRQVIPF